MRIAILYATREGHTRKVAEYLSRALVTRGIDVEIRDLQTLSETLSLADFGGAILAASVHYGKHEDEMVAFVRAHRAALEQVPCAFLSVSGSQATAELPSTTQQLRAESVAKVQKTLDTFFAKTGWHPPRVLPVVGALAYARYNFVIRFIIRWIARRSGQSIDTSAPAAMAAPMRSRITSSRNWPRNRRHVAAGGASSSSLGPSFVRKSPTSTIRQRRGGLVQLRLAGEPGWA
jgi:menaquinone-dependent protoporphyrinogen oxidase